MDIVSPAVDCASEKKPAHPLTCTDRSSACRNSPAAAILCLPTTKRVCQGAPSISLSVSLLHLRAAYTACRGSWSLLLLSCYVADSKLAPCYHCREDIKLDIYDWQEQEDRLITEWRVSGIVQLPWKPLLAAAGGTTHVFDKVGWPAAKWMLSMDATQCHACHGTRRSWTEALANHRCMMVQLKCRLYHALMVQFATHCQQLHPASCTMHVCCSCIVGISCWTKCNCHGLAVRSLLSGMARKLTVSGINKLDCGLLWRQMERSLSCSTPHQCAERLHEADPTKAPLHETGKVWVPALHQCLNGKLAYLWSIRCRSQVQPGVRHTPVCCGVKI